MTDGENERSEFRAPHDALLSRNFINSGENNLPVDYNVWSDEPLLVCGQDESKGEFNNTKHSVSCVNIIDYHPSVYSVRDYDEFVQSVISNKNRSVLDMGPVTYIEHPPGTSELDLEASSKSKNQPNSFSWLFSWAGKRDMENGEYHRLSRSPTHSPLAGMANYIPHTNRSHKKTLGLLFVQLIATFALFSVPFGEYILYPFHVIGVLFHELGHAFMAWITGAKVLSIKVGPNVDGLTSFIGGSFCMISPAGYLGSAVAGGLLLFCSFSQRASVVTAWTLTGCFVTALVYSVDIFSFMAPLIMLVFMICMLRFEDKRRDKYLRWIISMMGVTASIFSIWDIIRDLVLTNDHRSDAYQFATHCLYSPAIVVGIVWCVMAVFIIILSVIFGIKMFPRVSSTDR